MLDSFDFYAGIGWEVIPLRPGTKLPFTAGWNAAYDPAAMRGHFARNPYCNMGLRLGKIIDVEADDEAANGLLRSLTKDVRHPSYQSAKSVHHLFQSPGPELTRITIHGMEFRGFRHQSVLPPSLVEAQYVWVDTNGYRIPQLPASLLNLYNRHDRMMREGRNRNWVEPWCAACGRQSRPIHRKRFNLELLAFEKTRGKWLCRKCRKKDVRSACRKIKRSRLTTVTWR